MSNRVRCDIIIRKSGERAPMVGEVVKIIIKPYERMICSIGIVSKLLTKKRFHSRGHKVRLQNGEVGRVVEIISNK